LSGLCYQIGVKIKKV